MINLKKILIFAVIVAIAVIGAVITGICTSDKNTDTPSGIMVKRTENYDI